MGQEKEYDVALWLAPVVGGARFPEYVEAVEAAFPLAAVVLVMQRYRLRAVAYAVVNVKGKGIVRFYRGVRIIVPCESMERR